MKTVKKILSLAAAALPHINIALCFVTLTLLVTDSFNRAMNFINNDITKSMLAVFCVLVIAESVIYSYIQRKGK
jgi:hypothetical protein